MTNCNKILVGSLDHWRGGRVLNVYGLCLDPGLRYKREGNQQMGIGNTRKQIAII